MHIADRYVFGVPVWKEYAVVRPFNVDLRGFLGVEIVFLDFSGLVQSVHNTLTGCVPMAEQVNDA